MSSKEGRGKKERKSARKSEESTPMEEKKIELVDPSPQEPIAEPVEEVIEEPPKDPSPEPSYDEPVLSELIVESFCGEKARGLYHGEGTIDFTGGHHYEGEFCEGLMHGKGKYTWENGIVYEGDFDRNQITGEGGYVWPDGSSYKGEVLCGKRHGFGTFKCASNAMIYSGKWVKGKRNGKGRMEYDPEGRSYYDGDWMDNIRHGFGTRQYPSGNIYEGMWFNHVRHGEGTMKWLDRDQIYSGQWENGIQNGKGQHFWLLPRKAGSQYPLRNMYDGDFVGGLRHGSGVFFYASGAKYEGGWKSNMKHGQGKFTFKNGRIYEGYFEKDHIVEFPDFTMDGSVTPDMSMIRTRTPMAHETDSVHSNSSRNTVGPSFQLDIDSLLAEMPGCDAEEEANQLLRVIIRHTTNLKKIYNYYSGLGHKDSPDNTFIMNKMQFWRFLKDCQFHYAEISLTEMDRLTGWDKSRVTLHNPYERILQRQFVNSLVILAYYIYREEHDGSIAILAWCLSKLINEKILQHACNVRGHFYYETRRAMGALAHLDQAFDVYQKLATPRSKTPNEPVIKMRQFLHVMDDLGLLNTDLTPRAIINVLRSDDPNVADDEGCCNLELEMTFLEFFEALIGCAEVFVTEKVVKDPSTPRPSTVLTVEQSMYSIPITPAREANSQIDENIEISVPDPHRLSPNKCTTPENSSNAGRGNSATEVKPDVQNSVSGSEPGRQASSHHSSAKQNQDLEVITEDRNATPVVSSHTVGTEDNPVFLQSSVSLVAAGTITGDNQSTVECDEEDEIDEATRKFNFWTHQVHIFFDRKFFPAAYHLVEIRDRVKKQLTLENWVKVQNTPSPATESVVEVIEAPV